MYLESFGEFLTFDALAREFVSIWKQGFEELAAMPWYFWAIIPPICFTQGTWLFIDARKRESCPWFWGLWGMISFPMPLILYLLIVRKIYRHCGMIYRSLKRKWTMKKEGKIHE